MKAEIVPFSSTVGSSVLVTDDDGRILFQLSILNVYVEEGETIRQAYEKYAWEVAERINSYEVG